MAIWTRGRRNNEVEDHHLIDQNQIADISMSNPPKKDNCSLPPYHDIAKHSRPGLNSPLVMHDLHCSMMNQERHGMMTQHQSNENLRSLITRSPAISKINVNGTSPQELPTSIANRHDNLQITDFDLPPCTSTTNAIDTGFGQEAQNCKNRREKKEAGNYYRPKAHYYASISYTQCCTKYVSCQTCQKSLFVPPMTRQFFCQNCNGFSKSSS